MRDRQNNRTFLKNKRAKFSRDQFMDSNMAASHVQTIYRTDESFILVQCVALVVTFKIVRFLGSTEIKNRVSSNVEILICISLIILTLQC